MEFHDLIQKRRSVRRFVPSEIGDEVILRILEAGRVAPSGCNLQNREFVVIRDRNVLAQIEERIQADFKNAAAAIAVVMNPDVTRWGSYWVEDCSAAVTQMLLAIVDEGYDSVWIEGTLLRHEEWAKDLLAIPAGKRLYVLLPIGKAAEENARAAKADLDDIVFYER
ncbi:nitroreductase family protein, partial [bacterium]|nr:nitroreductase family protein [bacterium]